MVRQGRRLGRGESKLNLTCASAGVTEAEIDKNPETEQGRIYGTGDLARVYNGGDRSFTLKRKTSDSEQEEITHLKQELAEYKEKIRRLEQEQRDFQSVVMQFLPIEAKDAFQQNQQQRNQQNDQEDQEKDQQQQDSPNYDDY
ncbi:hypothetical protein Fmac_013569 [Flemingia macrophylla]|uniref:Uncharacterized protein n=1 Tax=Flemingia macrophylla TaxID=520843 RepID=A0ABD1MUG5_9FABA